jgi:hypothetical protein
MESDDVDIHITPDGTAYFMNMAEMTQIANRSGFWYAQKNMKYDQNLIQRRKDLASVTARRRLNEIRQLLNQHKLKQANDKLRNWKNEIETNNYRFQTRVKREKQMYEFLDGCLVKKFGADVTVAAIGVGMIFCPVAGVVIGAAVLSAGITGYAEYNYAGTSGFRSIAMAGLSLVPCATELMPVSKTLVITVRSGVNFEAPLAKIGINSAAGAASEYLNSGSIKSAIVQATVAGAGGIGLDKNHAASKASQAASRYRGSARATVYSQIHGAAAAVAAKAERQLKQVNATTLAAVSANNIFNSSIKSTSALPSKGSIPPLRHQSGEETYIWEPFPTYIPPSQRGRHDW